MHISLQVCQLQSPQDVLDQAEKTALCLVNTSQWLNEQYWLGESLSLKPWYAFHRLMISKGCEWVIVVVKSWAILCLGRTTGVCAPCLVRFLKVLQQDSQAGTSVPGQLRPWADVTDRVTGPLSAHYEVPILGKQSGAIVPALVSTQQSVSSGFPLTGPPPDISQVSEQSWYVCSVYLVAKDCSFTVVCEELLTCNCR